MPAVLNRTTTLIFALASGIAVSNVYWSQPILELMARDLRVDARSVGAVSVAMQFGYALGIATFVPLGDLLPRRMLVVRLFAAVTVALAGCAFAPNLFWVALAAAIVGLTTNCAQILVPFAADLAPAEQRGRLVGYVQSGLIGGQIFARAAGGLIGYHFGWRSVFVFAALLSAGASVVLARLLPAEAPRPALRYRAAFGEMLQFVGRYPALRASMGLGFVSFGLFAGNWTILAFHLHELGYGSDVVGGIALLSFVGVFAASSFGALCDRYGTVVAGTIGLAILVVAFGLFLTIGWSLWGLVVASAVFPLGTQITQISNQYRVFAISGAGAAARSRLNTVYVFTSFLGGAFGALLCSSLWPIGGWNGVCYASLGLIAFGAVVLAWYRGTQMKRG